MDKPRPAAVALAVSERYRPVSEAVTAVGVRMNAPFASALPLANGPDSVTAARAVAEPAKRRSPVLVIARWTGVPPVGGMKPRVGAGVTMTGPTTRVATPVSVFPAGSVTPYVKVEILPDTPGRGVKVRPTSCAGVST